MNRATNNATKTIAAPSKVKPTARATGNTKPQAEVATDEGIFAEAMKRYTEAQESLLKFFKAPSWKRTLVAFVTSIVVGCGIGWVAGTLLNWIVAGATLMAVPTFIVMLVYVLGFIAALYFGGKLAARIGGAVLTGEADERAIAAYDAVKSFASKLNPFGRRTIEVA